jgi:hypothetical protein
MKLCSCLHKYLLTYPLFMYNCYATNIFLPWILHIHKLYQNRWKLNFQFLSKNHFIQLSIFKTSYSYQVKVFPKVPNQATKRKLNKKFHKILHITCKLICNMIFLVNHHVQVMHMNVCKKIPIELSCLNHVH